MPEYRLRLDSGDILVVSLEVEPAEDAASLDPASIGEALLGLIGKRPAVMRVRPTRQQPPEESAEDWLARTSKESLKGMK